MFKCKNIILTKKITTFSSYISRLILFIFARLYFSAKQNTNLRTATWPTVCINVNFVGKLKLPTKAKSWFWMDGSPKADFNFYMNGIQINSFFKRIQVDMTFNSRLSGGDNCLRSYYNDFNQKFAIVPSPCWFQSAVICRKLSSLNPYCKGGFKFVKKSTIDWMVDPDIKANKTRAIAYKKAVMQNMMLRLNQTLAYETLFSILWYANLPCFDIKGITANRNGDRSILKSCKWKGVDIPCSAIFTTFPTGLHLYIHFMTQIC
jgi:hypothetical protein